MTDNPNNNQYETEPCHFCSGSGQILTTRGDLARCPICLGTGEILVRNDLRPELFENEDEEQRQEEQGE